MARLNAKQKRFVDEYLIDLNATQAAIRAGYKKTEYTDTNANKLLENTRIREAIDKAMAERSKRTGINQDRVIQELARIAFVNPQNVINAEDGSVREDATEDDLACIQAVKVKTMSGDKGYSEEREVRLNDKMKALELLGKHLGMFTDKVELDADLELNINIDYGDGENE
jgi:phage terminase small subunit|nr:MAG TPA: Terminase small subunit [Caudoviricetes sp.]